MTASPSMEIVPALDETRPEVGPNLAGDEDFCRDVAAMIYRDHAYPYLLMQQRLWPIWGLIDDAWRVKTRASTLDISVSDPALYAKTPDAKGKDGGMTSNVDGYSAKVQPAAVFKQIKTKTDLHMSIAYADGLPVRATMPKTIVEHPVYKPTQQSVDAFNELLALCADEVDLEVVDRKGRGCWSKFGFVFVATDFKYQLEDTPIGFELPQDQQQAALLVDMESQRFRQQAQFVTRRMADGSQRTYAYWTQRVVKKMCTDFVPLRHDDVLIDLTLSGGIQRQPCPCVREHGTRYDLLENDYDPDKNPFGYLNAQRAYADKANQYTLSAIDEQQLRTELLKKWNQESQGIVPQKEAIKQRWTCYPMLSVVDGENGKKILDKGDGVDCPTCKGRSTIEAPMDPMTGEGTTMVPCPQCQGIGKIFGKPERYIVQLWGLLMSGGQTGIETGCTVLRIQKNPNPKKRIPLIFGAHLIEDDAGAIPMSVVEASISSLIQLATAHNQFLDWKNRLINPPWTVPMESPHKNKDLNRANGTVTWELRPDENAPINLGSIDATNELIHYIQLAEGEIKQIIGMSDQLLGLVESGRRSASEITTAFDAAKMPVTVEIDSYNRQILEPWAQDHMDNIEAWADRDWIRDKTGRTTFGKVKLFSAVADEFMKKMGLIQNTRYVLEASVNDPTINRAVLWQKLLELTGLPDVEMIVNDQGMRKAIMDASKVVTQILGEGIPLPPDPSDPDDIYIAYFEQALRDEYWQKSTPENMPILSQRLQLQKMQAEQKMLEQMQQLQEQQAALGPPQGQGGGGNGNQPGTPNKTPKNKTQANQQMAGAAQG